MSYLPAAFSSLQSSTDLLNSLQFTHNPSLSLALLAPEATFETHLIRDAAPHELALFQPSTSRYDAPILLDSADLSTGGHHEERWTAAKRAPPQRVGGWEKASPLKERRIQGQEDPNRCLKAAEKLLGIYPMPRAQEHVQALHDQYEGLMDTLHELEGQLKRPVPRSALNPHAEEHARAAELEELIKREQMEIFALEQLKVEKEAEIQASASTRPAPRKPPVPTLKPARSRASLGREASAAAPADPFAKSSLLDSKRAAISSSSAAKASPPRPIRPARSTPTASPGSTPQTTPRATRMTRTSLGSASAADSPVKSPARATSSKSPARAAASSTRSMGGAPSAETTPKRTAARRSIGGAVGGRKSVGGKKGVEGVSQDDLEAIATKIWTVPALGDALRPWGRKALQAQDEEVPESFDKLSCEQTIATLTHILNAPPAPELPSSPGSIISSTLTTDSTALEPTPPSSAAILEYKLLQLLLNVLSGAAPPSATLPELTITLKEPVLASSLGGSPTLPQRGKKDPLVSMLALKAHLGEFAKERGWDESGGTTAIYGLVSKGVVRIDRRGREGGLVGLRV